jgi:hypothetical protein
LQQTASEAEVGEPVTNRLCHIVRTTGHPTRPLRLVVQPRAIERLRDMPSGVQQKLALVAVDAAWPIEADRDRSQRAA